MVCRCFPRRVDLQALGSSARPLTRAVRLISALHTAPRLSGGGAYSTYWHKASARYSSNPWPRRLPVPVGPRIRHTRFLPPPVAAPGFPFGQPTPGASSEHARLPPAISTRSLIAVCLAWDLYTAMPSLFQAKPCRVKAGKIFTRRLLSSLLWRAFYQPPACVARTRNRPCRLRVSGTRRKACPSSK